MVNSQLTSNWPLPTEGIRFLTPQSLCQQLGANPLTASLYPVAMGYYPNAKEQVTNCLQNFGFTVAQAGAGLQFEGNQAKALQIHINKAKVETANPPALYTEAMQNQTKLAHQLHETQQDLTAANERVHQNAQSRPSSTPFYTGLAAGLVAGAALASIIFNI